MNAAPGARKQSPERERGRRVAALFPATALPASLRPHAALRRVTAADRTRGAAGAPRSGRRRRHGAGRALAPRPQPGTAHAGRRVPAPPRLPARHHSPHLGRGTGRLVGARGTRRAFRARCHPRAGRTASWRPRPRPHGPRGWAGRRGRYPHWSGEGWSGEGWSGGFLRGSPRAGATLPGADSALAHFLIVLFLSLKGTAAARPPPPPDRKEKGCSELPSGGARPESEPQRGRDPRLGGGGNGWVPFGHLQSTGAGKSRTWPTVNRAGWAS